MSWNEAITIKVDRVHPPILPEDTFVRSIKNKKNDGRICRGWASLRASLIFYKLPMPLAYKENILHLTTEI